MSEELIEKTGSTNTIHGWNPNYVNKGGATRFDSFDINARRHQPDKFNNLPVVITPPPASGKSDHQGHIVPQNMLGLVLTPAMNAAYNSPNRPTTIDRLNTFLKANFKDVNWQKVTDYITWLIANSHYCEAKYFVTTDEGDDAESWYGGYFSVIMWNPVNICRAPDDRWRNGKPGAGVDIQVISYILLDAAQPGITLLDGMADAFRALPQNPDRAAIAAYISSCNTALKYQQGNQAGYYRFSWQPTGTNGALVPGPYGWQDY